MNSTLNPYIHFKDIARQAMEFYKAVFGGELTMSTFKEFGMSQNASEENLIMHSQLVAPNGITLMGADTPAHMTYDDGKRISVSLSGDDEAQLKSYWEKLADGATITQPLEQAPWGDSFGMLTDQFGVEWMVNIAGNKG